MSYISLCKYKQHLPLLKALRQTSASEVLAITHPDNRVEPIDLEHIVKHNLLGFSKAFQIPGHRQWNSTGFTTDPRFASTEGIHVFDKPTEHVISIYGCCKAKFYLVTEATFDALTIARCISNGTLVVLESTNPVHQRYYTPFVILTEDALQAIKTVNSMSVPSIKDMAQGFQREFVAQTSLDMERLLKAQLGAASLCSVELVLNDDPEDQFNEIEEATFTTNPADGQLSLKLTPSQGIDALPVIAIGLQNVAGGCSEIEAWNKRQNRYPAAKIRYHEADNDKELLERLLQDDEAEFAVIWRNDTLYLEHSCYAKVKLLQDYGRSVVLSKDTCVYNLINNESMLVEGRSMGYAFCIDYIRRNTTMNQRKSHLDLVRFKRDTLYVSYVFNGIGIDQTFVPLTENEKRHYGLFNFDTKDFLASLYKNKINR